MIRLYDVLANVRTLMSALAVATQGLVVVAMLAGIMAILTLHRRQFAVLRALGAPRLYIFLCVWMQTAFIAVAGALMGLLLGAAAARVVSHLITRATGIVLTAQIGLDELLLVADGRTDLAVSDAAIHSGKHASMQPRHCSRVAPRISSTASAFWRLRTLNKIRKGLSRSVLGR